MQNQISKSKIIVYTVIGLIILAALAAVVIYVPELMQTLHGTG